MPKGKAYPDAVKFVFDINGGDTEVEFPFSERIRVQVDSGDFGGSEAWEFGEHIKEALSEWYDGAMVSVTMRG